MESRRAVTGVAMSENEAIVSVIKVPDSPGNAGKLFTELGKAGVNVDMIIQSVEQGDENSISFSVQRDDLLQAKTISEEVAKALNAEGVETDDNVAKVSVVGVGMLSRPGVAAKMFAALGDAGINILRITTSEIKISCAIPRDQAREALNILHATFELDA